MQGADAVNIFTQIKTSIYMKSIEKGRNRQICMGSRPNQNSEQTRLRIVLGDVVGELVGMTKRAVPILRPNLTCSPVESVGTWHPNALMDAATCRRHYRTT